MTTGHTIPMNSLSFAAARSVLDTAIANATDMGFAVCVTVCDPAGEPIISGRMNGAARMSAGIAANKAYTVASFLGLPTNLWWGAIESQPALVQWPNPHPAACGLRRWRANASEW